MIAGCSLPVGCFQIPLPTNEALDSPIASSSLSSSFLPSLSFPKMSEPISRKDRLSTLEGRLAQDWAASGRTMRRGSADPAPDTLAVRRLRSSAKLRLCSPRRRARSLDRLPRLCWEEEGDSCAGGAASLAVGRIARGEYFASPTIEPIKMISFELSAKLFPSNSGISSPSTGISTFATDGHSSLATSPISSTEGQHPNTSSSRRISDPTPPTLLSPPITSHPSRIPSASAAISTFRPTTPHFRQSTSRSRTPTLPSPLSFCLSASSVGRLQVGRERSPARSEFPFPPSPTIDSFSPTTGTPSPPPETTPSSSLTSFTKLHQGSTPSPPSPERRRSLSSSSALSPVASSFPPASWRTAPQPTNFPSPLTPPDSTSSRHISAADLAWSDLSRLGGLSSLSLHGVQYGMQLNLGGTISAPTSSVPQVGDLMSLDDTPLSTGSARLGVSANTTPATELKRVGNEDLMGGTGGGHFGPATREKLAQVINDLIGGVPLSPSDKFVHIVEYGALNSRSSSLVPPIISHFATRHEAARKALDLPLTDENSISFQIIHADKLESDFRQLTQQLETHSDSYLNQQWQNSHLPSLSDKVFSSFACRPFGAKVLPQNSVSVGFSAMALHWLSTDRKHRVAPATLAHAEMQAFLSARATEFKTGGLLTLAFISRSDDYTPLSRGASLRTATTSEPALQARERSNSSPTVPAPRQRDVWTILSGILGKAIQRLVSTQLLKPAVARQLLALPIHPRTPLQTRAVLRSVQHAWTVEVEERIVISHPAWRGLEHKTIPPASYIDHTIQLLKIMWESDLRQLLREALLSRAACEWVLECLFDIAREKAEEEGPQPLELEVQIVALRRKERGT